MSDASSNFFISYSWTTPEHEEMVLQLATSLRSDGVDVVLDKWDLREGNDIYAFMEKMVNASEAIKVALICDKAYAEKANQREGGVGVETQIITPEIYGKVNQDKFVAVIVERDEQGKPYLPNYYKGKMYIDLSDEVAYAANYDKLLRWAHGKPLHEKPLLGDMPQYLNENSGVAIGTYSHYQRVIDAVRNGKSHWRGSLIEYFALFSQNLERFRMQDSNSDRPRDEELISNLNALLPCRNELVDLFIVFAMGLKPSPSGETFRFIY